MIKFQYASDLHLEVWSPIKPFEDFLTPPNNSEKDNTILVLAGDIAPITHTRLRDFLKWCSIHYKLVFFVSGNHEFYSKAQLTIEESSFLKRELCKSVSDNVISLDNQTYIINRKDLKDIAIIGSTMWSEIDMERASSIEKCINDYRQIGDFDVYSHVSRHHTDVSFIDDQLKNLDDDKYIKFVITHHAPLKVNLAISEKYLGDPNNSAFTTDLEDIVKKADYWLYGHTHFSTFNKIGRCVVSANCKGHSRDTGNNFELEKIITI